MSLTALLDWMLDMGRTISKAATNSLSYFNFLKVTYARTYVRDHIWSGLKVEESRREFNGTAEESTIIASSRSIIRR